MRLDTESALKQIDAALLKYEQANRSTSNAGLVTLLSATIERLAPKGSQYIKRMEVILAHDSYGCYKWLAEILEALRVDYEAGHLQSISALIHADVFSDFLEMSQHLLDSGYKDPAAVMAGGVLEEHLRKLSEANGISVTDGERAKKAEVLNQELASHDVYTKGDQKNVTAWLDLRNKAAHGKYAEYTAEQVALLIQSIRDFLTRVPA